MRLWFIKSWQNYEVRIKITHGSFSAYNFHREIILQAILEQIYNIQMRIFHHKLCRDYLLSGVCFFSFFMFLFLSPTNIMLWLCLLYTNDLWYEWVKLLFTWLYEIGGVSESTELFTVWVSLGHWAGGSSCFLDLKARVKGRSNTYGLILFL